MCQGLGIILCFHPSQLGPQHPAPPRLSHAGPGTRTPWPKRATPCKLSRRTKQPRTPISCVLPLVSSYQPHHLPVLCCARVQVVSCTKSGPLRACSRTAGAAEGLVCGDGVHRIPRKGDALQTSVSRKRARILKHASLTELHLGMTLCLPTDMGVTAFRLVIS